MKTKHTSLLFSKGVLTAILFFSMLGVLFLIVALGDKIY